MLLFNILRVGTAAVLAAGQAQAAFRPVGAKYASRDEDKITIHGTTNLIVKTLGNETFTLFVPMFTADSASAASSATAAGPSAGQPLLKDSARKLKHRRQDPVTSTVTEVVGYGTPTTLITDTTPLTVTVTTTATWDASVTELPTELTTVTTDTTTTDTTATDISAAVTSSTSSVDAASGESAPASASSDTPLSGLTVPVTAVTDSTASSAPSETVSLSAYSSMDMSMSMGMSMSMPMSMPTPSSDAASSTDYGSLSATSSSSEPTSATDQSSGSYTLYGSPGSALVAGMCAFLLSMALAFFVAA